MTGEDAVTQALQEHNNYKVELDNQKIKYEELSKELAAVKKQLAEKEEMTENAAMSSRLDKFEKELTENTAAIRELDSRWNTVANLLQEYEAFKNNVNHRLNLIDQYSRLSSLLIHGLLNIPTGKEFKGLKFSIWVAAELTRLLPSLTAPITAQHIDVAHPLPTKSRSSKSVVIVKFCRRDIRNEIFYAKRDLKGSGISISEHLTTANLNLYNEAQKVPNSKTWTSQCKIFIKVEGHDKKVVNSKQDIDCFLQKEKSTSPHEITAPKRTGPLLLHQDLIQTFLL